MRTQPRVATFALAGILISPAVVVPAVAAPDPLPSPLSSAIGSEVSSADGIAAGVVLQARTHAGSPVPGALVFVYRAHPAADGRQQPVGTGLTDAAGNVTIPLPSPTTGLVGADDGNYLAAYFGLGPTAANDGIEYFALTSESPVPVVTIENNLPPMSCIAPTVFPPELALFGYTIETDADEQGVVHVATAHGAGSWSGNSIDVGGLEQSSAEAIGEVAVSQYERTTIGTVGMRLALPGFPVGDGGGWNNDGFLKFGPDASADTTKVRVRCRAGRPGRRGDDRSREMGALEGTLLVPGP